MVEELAVDGVEVQVLVLELERVVVPAEEFGAQSPVPRPALEFESKDG